MLSRVLVFLLSFVLLGACATVGTSQPVFQPSPKEFATLPKPAIARPFHREQLLVAKTDGGIHSLQTILDADGEKITFAGVSTLGARLFKIVYTSGQIEVEQLAGLPNAPSGAQVLSDIMLSTWPVDAWRGHLPSGWALTDEGDSRRVLRDGEGKVVEDFFYENRNGLREPVRIVHRIFHYDISIQNLEDDT
ncbi:MAG: DUF3261 domain-containing protein [Puniceicoccales bacterium]|jgi:hypothetical protein|nr:DUF3261 domain-containing protein [Puniceicoccales bacterium]